MNDVADSEQPAAGGQIPGSDSGVFLFDGRGGVTRDTGEMVSTAPLAKGFKLIVGSLKSDVFHDWLKQEVGALEAAAMAAAGVTARCRIMEDKALIVMRLARPMGDEGHASRHLMGIWLEKGRLVLATDVNIAELMGLTSDTRNVVMPRSSISFVARMALRTADRIDPLIEKIGETLDDIEENLVSGGTRAELNTKLPRLRRNLIGFRRLIWPQRDVLSTLEVEQLPFATRRDMSRLREASMRTARLGDELQALSERASLVREQIMDEQAKETNRALLILAAVTTIFLPPTLLTGMLGMNVAGIPFADYWWAFAAITLAIVVLGIGQWLWFRHRRWM